MKNVKALFIDCDGVLYNKEDCSYQDIAIVGLGKTLDEYNIARMEVATMRAMLKKRNVRGLLNATLGLCQKHEIPFTSFADRLVANTDYSRVSRDKEMLDLLQVCGNIVPIYIVTNNTKPHLNKIFSCLGTEKSFDEIGIHPITIEDTLYDGVFHPKKVDSQLSNLCDKVGAKPEEVLLLDDTEDVCNAASEQGLQVQLITTPNETKATLRRIIHEKTRCKRRVTVRKTCGRSSH